MCLIAESLPGLIWLKVLKKIDLDWMNATIALFHHCPLDIPSKASHSSSPFRDNPWARSSVS
jgi:hypothetical protein